MTRQDWHQQVLDSTPGRFEGEQDWTPYFWDCYMNGDPGETKCGCPEDADYCECTGEQIVSVYEVSEEEHGIFPELEVGDTVRLWQADQGFICTEVISK